MRSPPAPRIKQAVLLVGGKGTRLGNQTKTTPKPLMPIGHDRVFLDLLIDNVTRQGFTNIVLLAGYLGDQIVSRYQNQSIRDATIEVLVEAEPLGTGGALKFAAGKLDQWFLLVNGDTYFDIGYRALEVAVRNEAPGLLGVIALRDVADCSRYGRVETVDGVITAFREKEAHSVGSAGSVNAGVYLLNRSIIDLIAAGPVSLEEQVFPELVARRALLGVNRAGYFVDIGLPETLEQARMDLPSVMRRPALFLDRDGVINHDHAYVHRWADFDWVDGAREVIRAANEAGVFVFVVTNQAGVARGYYDEAAVQSLHGEIADALAIEGAHIDAFYYCPFHPEGALPRYRREHQDRKPNPGMLLRAMMEWPVDRGRSFLVGDRESDIAAANSAGIPGLLFPGGNLKTFLTSMGRWPIERT